MVATIDLLLKNQQNDYLIAWEEAKLEEPKRCKGTVFKLLRHQVTPFAIRQIQTQVDRVIKAIEADEPLPPCTKSFQTTMGLPCAHHLAGLIKDDKPIELKDMDWHWKFVRPVTWQTCVVNISNETSDPLHHHGRSSHHTPSQNSHQREPNQQTQNRPLRTRTNFSPPPPYVGAEQRHNPSQRQPSFTHEDRFQSPENQPANLSPTQSNRSENTARDREDLETSEETDLDVDFPLDPRLCGVEEPEKMKARGRSPGSQNKKKTHAERRDFRKVYTSRAFSVRTS